MVLLTPPMFKRIKKDIKRKTKTSLALNSGIDESYTKTETYSLIKDAIAIIL